MNPNHSKSFVDQRSETTYTDYVILIYGVSMRFIQILSCLIGLLGLVVVLASGASIFVPDNAFLVSLKPLSVAGSLLISVAMNLVLLVEIKKLRGNK